MAFPLQRDPGSFELYAGVEFVKLPIRPDYIDKEQNIVLRTGAEER